MHESNTIAKFIKNVKIINFLVEEKVEKVAKAKKNCQNFYEDPV